MLCEKWGLSRTPGACPDLRIEPPKTPAPPWKSGPFRATLRIDFDTRGIFTLGLGALTALSKSKKHFVGLTWANGDQKGGLAMQCDKNDYRGILAGLEGVSGKKAVDSEAMTVKN